MNIKRVATAKRNAPPFCKVLVTLTAEEKAIAKGIIIGTIGSVIGSYIFHYLKDKKEAK